MPYPYIQSPLLVNIITGEDIIQQSRPDTSIAEVKGPPHQIKRDIGFRKGKPIPDGTTVHMSSSPSKRLVSSNAYANGSDQNCGNVLTEKRIIRIAEPPGGRSSFSIATMFDDSKGSERFKR